MISKNEIEKLNNAFTKILGNTIEEKDFEKKLPLDEKLADSNKVYSGKLSVMFIDIRDSTKLPDKYSSSQIVKLYRAYTRAVVQGVRYNGGFVRDYMGDGVLAFFLNDEENRSSDNAVQAARYISTVINLILNPLLKKYIKGMKISFGIGICTGKIMMTKVGMKGKEADPDSEDEHGIAWIGNATNKASKYSGLIGGGNIFIDYSTYKALSNKSDKWKEKHYVKNGNELNGYVASAYYLDIDSNVDLNINDIKEEEVDNVSDADILSRSVEKQLQQMMEEAKKLGTERERLSIVKAQLEDREKELRRNANNLEDERQCLLKQQLEVYIDTINSAYCKDEYIKKMGLDFWLKICGLIEYLANKLQIDVNRLKGERLYGLIDIYYTFELYENAYDYLVLEAEYGLSFVGRHMKEIIKKTGYHSTLKNTIISRIERNDMNDSLTKVFETALYTIKDLGY